MGHTDDRFQALAQQALQGKYTGGTVLHLYMNEAVSSAEACKTLVRRALANFRLPYITVTPTFSICPATWPGATVLLRCAPNAGPAIGLPRPGQRNAHPRRAARPTSHPEGNPTMQTLMTEPSTPQAATAPVLDDSQRVRCEVWTRVMGYHRPVSSFNTGKQGEVQ